METFTGLEVDPLKLRPEDIQIEDIAHSLSLQCRYGGHCRVFYSVAQHSMLVSERLSTPLLKLYGLLHDAAETYFGDMVTPLKKLVPQFESHELAARQEIYRKFCPRLPRSLEAVDIKNMDTRVLLAEAAFFMSTGGHGPAWTQHKTHEPIAIPPDAWPARVAEERFLRMFNNLIVGTNDGR